jgi:hypothetical protein
VRPRGTIEVKGKGPMATFLLDWAEPVARADEEGQAT